MLLRKMLDALLRVYLRRFDAPGLVTLRVVCDTGFPVPILSAKVAWATAYGRSHGVAYTGVDGQVFLPQISQDVALTISAAGFRPLQITIHPGDTGATSLLYTFFLIPKSAEELLSETT